MKAIDSKRWQRASPYLDRVLDLPLREREACLLSLKAEDAQVAADVEALLLAAANGLQSVPGMQQREREANRARLVLLYLALARPDRAEAYR
jgi:hypothetical protein